MADKNFKQLVQASRTYRRFAGEPVSREILLDLIDTARFAPSGNNLQVLRFALANDPEQVASIAQHHGWAALLKDFNGPAVGELPGAYIAICAPAKQVTNPIRLIDCGIAAQTICLAAAEKGLGACMIKSFDKQASALFGLGGGSTAGVGEANDPAASPKKEAASTVTTAAQPAASTTDYEPVLLIALGKPADDETVELEPGDTEHGVKYWRSEGNVHHVPKRSVDELVL